MLVRLLTLYFGDAFGYCDYYGTKDCCKKVPCSRAGRINLSKNHDFDLAVPQIARRKYLIQYRNFSHSVISNYEVSVLRGNEDSAISFRRFASAEFTRYKAFLDKWVTSGFGSRQLIICYEDMLADPMEFLSRAIKWIDPELEIDRERLALAITSVDGEKIDDRVVRKLPKAGIHVSRDIQNFRYATPILLQQLERLNLMRQTVMEEFRNIIGRDPKEDIVLGMQGFESAEALRDVLLNSEEGRARMSRT